MPRRWLVEETPQGTIGREVHLIDRPDRAGVLGSPLAWRILQELAKAPDYPNALASRLKVHEQKVYYHVRRLQAAGFLEVVREEPKRGASARILAPTADAFGIVLKGRGTPMAAPMFPHAGIVSRFLEEFARDGRFEGSIVVGSPYTHGPFNTTSRDSPYAVELGFFLGRLFGPPKGIVVRLDTEVKAAGMEREDMILVGGPVANIVTMDLNPHLAVNFDWRQVWRMESSRTRKPYADEQVGLIAKVRNPWNASKTIVLLSGLHAVGTMAAILGLTRFAEEVLDGYAPGEDFYRVVAGQDRDGDGRLDAVSVLE
ncbi:MAG TPA: helix-turn-helix domain-containing protein [Thermoplasmata archaeon]|jgi:DNA-binding transcriptional ArsR family regulator|nr:helix-turn-helix domain-containing protein [Thermoplasmata archaeon]